MKKNIKKIRCYDTTKWIVFKKSQNQTLNKNSDMPGMDMIQDYTCPYAHLYNISVGYQIRKMKQLTRKVTI